MLTNYLTRGILKPFVPFAAQRAMLVGRPAYGYLPHDKMKQMKKSLLDSYPKQHHVMHKIRYFWRETKYTMVQGFKDLWADTKWLYSTSTTKPKQELTGWELNEMRRIKIDLLKFLPYSVFLIVPFTEFFLPLYLYLFPNSVPSFFIFDTAISKQIEKKQKLQEEAYGTLSEKLLATLRKVAKTEEDFLDPALFRRDFFEVYYELSKNLNYRDMNSDELMQVADFLGINFITGTDTINKMVNLFTYYFPKYLLYYPLRWLYYKVTRSPAPPHKDPSWLRKSFDVLKFNYFPFEFFKQRLMLWQIDNHMKMIKMQDEAFLNHGIKDLDISQIKQFARNRGITSISCYESLKTIFKTEWISVTTHPKFDYNTTIWYSVMMYTFLKDKNKDMN